MITILHLFFGVSCAAQTKGDGRSMAQNLTMAGDEFFASRIAEAAAGGALSHAIIISGSGDLSAAARYTAAAMQCTDPHPPCGRCAACGKVAREIHPDVITVVDEEHKNISVDVLRNVRTDAYILPNEGRRKVYIFPDCEKLDAKAQNVLLKVVEEGPPHAAFIFCAANSAVLLQTIRSRAVEWKLSPVRQRVEVSEDAKRLCGLISERKSAEITALCTDLENSKISREDLRSLLSDARDIFTAALAASYGTPVSDPLAAQLARDMGRRRLAAVIEVLRQFIRDCEFNVGVGHLTGALGVALEL